MRYLSFFPAVLSALTGAIGSFAQGTSGQNAITYPLGGSLDGNVPLTITWTPTTQGTITINLLKGPPSNLVDLGPIAASINNDGTFTWTIPNSLQDSGAMPQGDRYGFKIIDDSTKTFEYSPPFDLSIPGSTFGGTTSSGTLSATASPTTSMKSVSSSPSSTSATPTPTPTSTTTQESTTSTSDFPTSTTTEPPASTSTDLPSDILPNSVDTSPQSTLAATTTSATPTPSQSKVADNNLTPSPGPNIPLIIGVSASAFGGFALLIVAIVVLVKCRRKRSRARARGPLATAQLPVQSMRGYDMYNRA
ncbi:Ser-Thr-rich glycosyl-phosphatidyl-inositol-anchored membrane family-domain-containing protein [Tuber borchii]|uniref:Ser-Thr-rich glycosyl-phosphatidyl-inositol-anchored membrane family-domain-containing protein n=1 Tax=Tuber borchii TaxID=42251 RepID=A0A2T6ZQL1_TUBBO|nr:Ser-Thr-rich glycosyl-phosphatidyl-inositol-anchored membrane family-domain-containing protein [Tuber borchii]